MRQSEEVSVDEVVENEIVEPSIKTYGQQHLCLDFISKGSKRTPVQ